MFRTIVVGTDGSPSAAKAVEAAGAMARLNDAAKVHVVSAYHRLSAGELERIRAQLPEEFRDSLASDSEAQANLLNAQRRLTAVGVECTLHELDGDPADALLDVADDLGADLIVIGSRGEGMSKRILHGSVSTKVMHHAARSVLVVK